MDNPLPGLDYPAHYSARCVALEAARKMNPYQVPITISDKTAPTVQVLDWCTIATPYRSRKRTLRLELNCKCAVLLGLIIDFYESNHATLANRTTNEIEFRRGLIKPKTLFGSTIPPTSIKIELMESAESTTVTCYYIPKHLNICDRYSGPKREVCALAKYCAERTDENSEWQITND